MIVNRQGVVETYSRHSWQRKVFETFSTRMLSETRPFPCIYGVAGLKADELRFGFIEKMNPERVADFLTEYVPKARQFGSNTSLVLFSRPGINVSIQDYNKRFWSLLAELARIDEVAWPKDIPTELNHPDWEFCFAGEPLFVVCNTPAHLLRQSRHAPSFMLTFQPRWVFDGILVTEALANRAFAAVRERLRAYDFAPIASTLGRYGDPNNREYAQYYLDDGIGPLKECPIRIFNREKATT